MTPLIPWLPQFRETGQVPTLDANKLAKAWRQQVRDEVLEEAAKVAESYEPHCDSCPRGVASAIRHLKGKP